MLCSRARQTIAATILGRSGVVMKALGMRLRAYGTARNNVFTRRVMMTATAPRSLDVKATDTQKALDAPKQELSRVSGLEATGAPPANPSTVIPSSRYASARRLAAFAVCMAVLAEGSYTLFAGLSNLPPVEDVFASLAAASMLVLGSAISSLLLAKAIMGDFFHIEFHRQVPCWKPHNFAGGIEKHAVSEAPLFGKGFGCPISARAGFKTLVKPGKRDCAYMYMNIMQILLL